MKSRYLQWHSRLNETAHILNRQKMPCVVVIVSTCLSPQLLLPVLIVAGFPFADRSA